VVILSVNTDYMYNVLARTPEEAENIAEDRFCDGEEGTPIGEPELLSSEALPTDSQTEAESFDPESTYGGVDWDPIID
jgi:hypothetical protein